MLLYVYLGLVLFLLVFVIKNMVRGKEPDAADRRRAGGGPAGAAAAADQMRGWTE